MTPHSDPYFPPREIWTPWILQAGGEATRTVAGLELFVGGDYICGPAATFACASDDNLALHMALYRAAPGSVLVGDGGGTRNCGLFGELMATDALAAGLNGLIVDGTVRDLADLDRLAFPVVAAGAAPAQCSKSRAVSAGEPVVVRGTLIHPRDQVVADRDGILVVPSAVWPEVRERALAVAEREASYLSRLAAGERLAKVLGLDLSPTV
jgi:4-hydroxy-4-methyl-2-oxoglutarate aldolase